MTQKETVLAMLKQAGPEGVTSNQFYAACLPRFGARIHELKKEQGLDIRKEPVEDGHFRYILVGRPFLTQQSPADLGEVGNSPPNLGGAHAQRSGSVDTQREDSFRSLTPEQLFDEIGITRVTELPLLIDEPGAEP